MRVSGISYTTSFQRRPTPKEQVELTSAIDKAYEIMGTKERSAITHGSCFPVYTRENFIGSPYGNSAKEYIKFLSSYGFNSIQLGPGGELQKGVNSPYKSSAFAQNRLFINLDELTTEKYGNILSRETYEKITRPLSKIEKNYTKTNFEKASEICDTALKEAYKNFKTNLKMQDPQTVELNDEFQKFVKRNEKRLDEEGVFKVLSNIYGTDDFLQWDADGELISDINKGDVAARKRFDELYFNNSEEIERYKFEQFLAVKQIKEHKKWRDVHGFKYINDLLVGCSKMDEWRYTDAFLSDWEMGAFEGNGVSQRWHIPVVDPKKIFKNSDYELNIGGQFIREKIESALEFCENLRIDHVAGLVEPYLISKNAKDDELVNYPLNAKRKDVEKYISELRNPENPDEEYDYYWDYPKLIEKLVLRVLSEHGIDKSVPVWEDLCSYPSRFVKVYDELKLPKITNLDWTRASDVVNKEPDNWFILGSHDNIPVMRYLDRKGIGENGEEIKYTRGQASWNSEYIAKYLNPDDTQRNIDEIRENKKNLYENDDRAIVMAKFAELLTTPKFQISFDDILGITDVIYNIPGTENEDNWTARISSDYLDKYYENLSSDSPTALNIPEILHDALVSKIDSEIKNHNYDPEFKIEIRSKATPILEKLKYFADVLKEKEK